MEEDEAAGRTVLLPIDNSDHSARAFEWYVKNLWRKDDLAIFVTVIEPIYTAPAFELSKDIPPLPDVARVLEENVRHGKELCKKFITISKSVNVRCQAFVRVDSSPRNALITSITEHKADFVVMGSRGVGVLRRTFLGSTSDYVLHHTHVPVIIVPPPAS